MNRIDGGTRYARKIASPICLAPENRSRSIAYAAKTDAASEKKVAVTETSTVFHIHSGYAVSNSNFLTWASVGELTQNGFPSRDKSSLSGLKLVTAIQ